MAIKTFAVANYTISMGRSLTIGGEMYKFYADIVCYSSTGDRLAIYFMVPATPVPDNVYNPATQWATIYLPEEQFNWYKDLLRNEKPVTAYCNSDKPAWNNLYTGPEFTGEEEVTPDVGAWLTAHPTIASAIIWEDPSGLMPYPAWNAAMKNDLQNAFLQAWNFSSISVTDPVGNAKVLANTDNVRQIYHITDAYNFFMAMVAQSLAVEIGSRVSWSIVGYPALALSNLFDSREIYKWTPAENGYEIPFGLGVVTPCNPSFAYNFLFNGIISGTRKDTIVNLIDWARANLQHFLGGWDTANVYEQWQYKGFPPLRSVILGTPLASYPAAPLKHRTGGCWGTTGFFRGLLRTVNIPVNLVTNCGHAQPHFINDNYYLTHGDDPYNQLTRAVPPMPASELLVTQAQFDSWFGPAVPAATKCNYVGRRTLDLSLIYLPNYLLKAYCADIAAAQTHANGSVFDLYKNLYTLAQLEAMNLWGKMDAKIASMGGCANVPN